MHPIAQTLNKIGAELRAEYYERDSLIEAALLAVVSKNHMFVLGPPGTAKTAALTNLMHRFIGATTFEALLSRTRPDAAILGPYNLPELRDKGNFHRKTNGFLPDATLAILDEIGKMSPVLGHDLLPLLNERVYHEVNGGRSKRAVPLYTCFTAANELITNDSDDAAALWDRLPIRVVVDYIQEPSNFQAMLTGGKPPAGTTVDWADVADAIDNAVPAIKLTSDALQAVMRLRDGLIASQIHPSDRRFKQSVGIMQASAFLNGRSEVTDEDVQVLRYTLWDTPEQIKPVERLTLSVSNPDAEKLIEWSDYLDEVNLGIDSRKEQAYQSKAAFGTESSGKLKVMTRELEKLRDEAAKAGRSTARIDQVVERHKAVRRRIFTDLLDMDPKDV